MNDDTQNDAAVDAGLDAALGAGQSGDPTGGAAGGADNTGQGADAGSAAGGQGQGQPQPIDLSDATVRRLASGLAGAMPQQQTQQQPQLTQDQIDDMLKVVKIQSEEVAEALGLDEERSPRAHKFLNDLVKRIVTHVNVVNDVRMRLFEQQRLAPLDAYMQRAQNEAYERQFFDTFPDLKPHAKIARLVYKDMIANGAKFSTPDDAFVAIAKATKALVGAGTGSGGDGNGATGQGGGMPQMSTISMGGRASGAAGGQQQKGSNPIKELFG